MKTLIGGLIALVTLAWGLDVSTAARGGSLPWIVRQEALNLSGLLAIAMMSLATFLAARPAWLERPLGGLDRMYRTHKWAGILAVGFAVVHWATKEVAGSILKATVGSAGKVPKEKFIGLPDVLRGLSKDMAEWGIYVLLAMLALALWKRFPYRPWRLLHQAMPVLYLTLAFHAVMWAPTDYWMQPLGALLALLIVAGAYGSVLALVGSIGRKRQVAGTVVAVDHPAPDVVGVRCRLEAGWRGHRPGQFAFITFDRGEGAHPFTIASADHGDRTVDFKIKALGDYTRGLADRLRAGQPVKIEGPYGRFHIARLDPRARQVWIAGGIGVTPFLAWLESLQTDAARAPAADLHYCTRDRDGDPFVARLESLCASLPGVRLKVHGARQGEVLEAKEIVAAQEHGRRAEIWFCGPRGLAEKLKQELRDALPGRFRFHQEAFEMR